MDGVCPRLPFAWRPGFSDFGPRVFPSDLMPLVFETPRLALREMSLADVGFVAEMLADPEVMRFYSPCDSRDEAEAWVLRQLDRYASFGFGLWLVLDKASSRPVGQVGGGVGADFGSPSKSLATARARSVSKSW